MSKVRRPEHTGTPRKTPRADHAGSKRLTAWLSHSILALAGLCLAAPLIVGNHYYYPAVFLKSVLFRAAAQLMLLVYVVLAVRSPSHRPRFDRITLGVLLYFGAMFVSSLPMVSVDAWSSWWGDFVRMRGMFTQLHLLVYFFVLAQTLKRDRDWVILFAASLFFGVLMGFSGLVQALNLNYLYQFNLADERMLGATGNAIYFAAFMMLNFFVVLWFLGRKDKEASYSVMAKCWLSLMVFLDLLLVICEIAWPGPEGGVLSKGVALLPVVLFALILHGVCIGWFLLRKSVLAGEFSLGLSGLYFLFWLYRSQTRGAVFALIGSLVLLLIVFIWTGASRAVKWGSFVSVVFILLLSIFVVGHQSSPLVSFRSLRRLTEISYEGTLKYRILAWNAALLGTLDRPVFGWGLENYKNAFDLHFPPHIFTGQSDTETWYDRSHNLAVDVAVMTGFVGLGAFLTLYGITFFSLLRRWFRTRDPASILIAALLLAYLLQALSSFDSINTDGIVYLAIAYVAYLARREADPIQEPSGFSSVEVPIAPKAWGLIVAIALLLLPAWYYLVSRPYDSNQLLKSAISREKVLDPQTRRSRLVSDETTIDLFRTASDYETTGRHEVREEFANYASELAQTPSVPVPEKVRAVTAALPLLEESIRQEPRNARHYMYYASLVNRSLGVVQRHNPEMATSLAERSLAYLRKAEALSPTRPQVYYERGETLSFLGRFPEGVAAFEKGLDLYPVQKAPHVDLVSLYILAGRYDDAQKEWQRIKALSFPLTAEDYGAVLRSYNSKRQFGPMADLYKEQLEKTPDDPALLGNLAATYRELGQIDLARATAIRGAALSPALKAGLQQFLDSLEKPK